MAADFKAKLIADILIDPGRIDTKALNKAIERAFGRVPNLNNLLSGKNKSGFTTKALTAYREELGNIVKDANEFTKAISKIGAQGTTDQLQDLLKDTNNRFKNLSVDAAKHVRGVSKSFDKLQSLYNIDDANRFYTKKGKLRKEIRDVIENPGRALNINEKTLGKLNDFKEFNRDLLAQAKELRGVFRNLGINPKDVPFLRSFDKDLERNLKRLDKATDTEALQQARIKRLQKLQAGYEKVREKNYASHQKTITEQAKRGEDERYKQAVDARKRMEAKEANNRLMQMKSLKDDIIQRDKERKLEEKAQRRRDHQSLKQAEKTEKERRNLRKKASEETYKADVEKEKVERRLEAARAQRETALKTFRDYGGVGGVRYIPEGELSRVRKGLAAQQQYINQQATSVASQRQALETKGKSVELTKAEAEQLKKLRVQQDRYTAEGKELKQGLEAINRRMSKFGTLGQQAAALMRQFFRFAIGYGALFQVLSGFLNLTRAVSQLNKELKSLQAITQSTNSEMQTIEATINQVALTTQFSTTEIAKAARILGQAGVEAREFPTALAAVARFAGATESPLELAADLLTTFRNVFNELDDTAIANQLTKAINISKLTADDLKTIASISAQSAKRYSLSSEQYLAAASVLRDSGIKASTIATGLRRASDELFSLDTRSLDAFKKRYDELGESISEAQIKARFFAFTQQDNPLVASLRELKRLGFAGSGKQEFARVFDIRAVNVISALINNLDDLAAAEAKITFGSAAAEGAQTQLESLSNSLDNLGAALTVFSTSLSRNGIAPLEDFVDTLTNAIGKMTEFNNALKAGGDSGIGEAVIPAIAAGILSSRLAPGGALGKAAFGTAGAALGGAAVLGLEQSGQDQAAEFATGAVTALVGASAIKTVGKAVVTKAGTFIRAFNKGVAVDAERGLSAVEAAAAVGSKGRVSDLLDKLTTKSSNLVKLVAASPIGRVITYLTILIGGVIAVLRSTADPVENLRKQLEQQQQNLRQTEAELREAQDSVDEFDVLSNGGLGKKGTTASTISKLQEQLENYESSLQDYFGSKAADVVKANEALAEFALATGGDSGSPLASSAFSKLQSYGFTGTQRQALELNSLREDRNNTATSLASEAFKALRRIQDRADEVGVSQLSTADRSIYDAFAALEKTEDGLKQLTLIKYPEQADITALSMAILDLSTSITQNRKEAAKQARQELNEGRAARDAKLIQFLESSPQLTPEEIERTLDNYRDTRAGDDPLEIQKDLQRLINALQDRTLGGDVAPSSETPAVDRLVELVSQQAARIFDVFEFIAEKWIFVVDLLAFTLTQTVEVSLGILESVLRRIGLDSAADNVANSKAGFDNNNRTFAQYVAEEAKRRNQQQIERERDARIKSNEQLLKEARGLEGGAFAESVKKALGATAVDRIAKGLGLTAEQLDSEEFKAFREALVAYTTGVKQLSETEEATRAARKRAIQKDEQLLANKEEELNLYRTTLDTEEELNLVNGEIIALRKELLQAQFRQLTVTDGLSDVEAQNILLGEQQNKFLKATIEKEKATLRLRDLKEKNERTLQGIRNRDIRPSLYEDLSNLPEAQRKRIEAERERQNKLRARSRDFQNQINASADISAASEALTGNNYDRAIQKANEAIALGQNLNSNFTAEYIVGTAQKLLEEATAKKELIEAERNAAREAELKEYIKDITNFTEKLGQLVKDGITPKVDLDTTQANNKIDDLETRLSNLNAVLTLRTTSEIPNETEDGGEVELKRSIGGSIPGYGGGDSVRALLEPGEEVIRKERASKYRKLLKFINNAPMSAVNSALGAGKFRLGGTVGFGSSAGGGSGGGSVIIQLPSGQQTPPLYGSNQAITAVQKMVFNEAGKIVRRRRV